MINILNPKSEIVILGNLMFIFFARLVFVILSTLCGLWIGLALGKPIDYAACGFFLSFIIIIFEHNTDIISSKMILFGSVGLLFGLILADYVYPTIPSRIMGSELAHIICNLFFGYFGVLLAVKHKDRFNLSRLSFILNPTQKQYQDVKILDTNVIIDGRIVDLLELNFISGQIIIPTFVIDELQLISDSADIQKRSKGRKGLDIVNELKERFPTKIEIMDKDYKDTKFVDQKLMELAKELKGDIITNDFNLKKIANIKEVGIFNINELANILKPTVVIGEVITIRILREGKDASQGVGYLDDGTMVVVDSANDKINLLVDVTVNSILQTSTGRMVFAGLINEKNYQNDKF